ncbi:MAG: hypothetical protein AAF829_01380 [Pseudomonadota bacterium]
MNTPAHLIAASALLARRGDTARNGWVIAGALMSDLWIFIFFAWAAGVQGLPGDVIWEQAYWTEPWQTIGAIFNSAPIALLIILSGIVFKRSFLLAFGLAMALHILLDLPLHADDAHRHFWPLTDWRLISPVSYWDPNAHGRWGILLECSIVLAGATALWLRFRSIWLRGLLALAVTASLAMVAVYWLVPPSFGA